MIIWLLCSLFSIQTHAADVAFLEIHKADGTPLQLEPGSRFMHVAIRFENQWLHAHSHGGVQLIDNLNHFGDEIVILRNPDIPDPSPEDFKEWLGKPFDFRYVWTNPLATYCTRLVANLLHIEPSPMTFAAPAWDLHAHRNVGGLGLSPDDLYMILSEKGFHPVAPAENCGKRLVKQPTNG